MFDLSNFAALIAAVDAALKPDEKGDALEALCRYIFECIQGVIVDHQDKLLGSEEIDLVLWNAKLEKVLEPWDPVILVECKNWSKHVGAPELDSFIAKLRRRALKTGIFIAACGVSGGFLKGSGNEGGAIGIIRAALQEGMRVIVLTMDDLRNIASLDDILGLIRKRYTGLFVHKVF